MTPIEKMSEKLTDWLGTPASILVHSILFIGIFGLRIFKVGMNDILLLLTTVVSLEAIYLAIFIQMTVNRTTKSLKEVEKDIDDIQEDVQEISEDNDEDDAEEDVVIKAIKDIENRLEKLHKDVGQINKR